MNREKLFAFQQGVKTTFGKKDWGDQWDSVVGAQLGWKRKFN